VVFGGKNDDANFVEDVWYLDYQQPEKHGWTQASLSHESKWARPHGRWDTAGVEMQCDNHSYLLMYGGDNKDTYNDMWVLDLDMDNMKSPWYLLHEDDSSDSSLKASTGDKSWPSVRGHCMASYGECVYLFGGQGSDGKDKNWVWAFNATKHAESFHENEYYNSTQNEDIAWEMLFPDTKADKDCCTVPEPRHASMCVMMDNRTMVLFGGERDLGKGKSRYLSALWLFDTVTKEWTIVEDGDKKQIKNGEWPSERAAGTVHLMDQGKHMVMLGGHDDKEALRDVWSLRLGSWSWKKLSAIPYEGHNKKQKKGRYSHASVKVEGNVNHTDGVQHERILLFGGATKLMNKEKKARKYWQNDVLEYDYGMNKWKKLTDSNCKWAKKQKW
jgi:hypothetical protein